MRSQSLEVTEAFSAARSTHPRVSLQSMKDKIACEAYFTAGDAGNALGIPVHAAASLLTICLITMTNGFTVIGKSAPASPENFDAEKGRTFAYEDAIKQLWPLEGYALREELTRAGSAEIQPHDGSVQFVGTKTVNAWPMTRREYHILRGWTEYAVGESPDDTGYLIEYTDGQRPNVPGYQGYVSWSPADVFEKHYRGPGLSPNWNAGQMGEASTTARQDEREIPLGEDDDAPTGRLIGEPDAAEKAPDFNR